MRRVALPAVIVVAALLALVPGARAEFGVTEFDVTFTDKAGEAVTLAGSHPYEMTTWIKFKSFEEAGEKVEGNPKNIILTQPEGFVGDPSAVPRCATADFLTELIVEGSRTANCPDATAVGTVAVGLAASGITEGAFYSAVYNLEPPPGVAAKLGFWVQGFPVTVELGVADSPPYNIVGGPTNITQVTEVISSRFTLWGNPAASSHDSLRGHCLSPVTGESLGTCRANLSVRPFLTMPRFCSGPLITRYAVDSWQDPGVLLEGSAETHDVFGDPVGIKGCGSLTFDPEASITPTTSAAESASGLDIAIDIEDEGLKSADGRAQADIAAMKFALPAGVTANPSAAEGLGTCSAGQFAAASLATAGCPPSSKLGTLEVDTPILEDHTLHGSFYLASQDDNPFGSLLAAYLVIRDPERGVFVKLATRIDTDPATGRIVTTTTDLPPFPLERVRVHLRSGPRAPLITPPACGTYSSELELTPSNGAPPLRSSSSFAITAGPGGGPCPAVPGPFSPGFLAGSENPAAGAHSPFSMRIERRDGEQDLTRLSAVLPPGVLGRVAGVDRCEDAAIAAAAAKSGRAELTSPSCPASSRIGSVLAGAGVGASLTYVPGSIHLAGPYGGAPLSIAAIVPAVAGPFDVGTVVTRFALDLDPITGQVRVDGAASDPIPHILQGVPLKLRLLNATVDRPGFTLNPTSCAPSATVAALSGSGANPFDPADDTAFSTSSRYQAASCASLGFRPKLTLRFEGETKRTGHPGVRAVLRPRLGDANARNAVTFLPKTTFVDAANVPGVCTREEFAKDACPKESILGRARAFTPLLDHPLEGDVYFRSNGSERELPDIVADLRGQFRIVLVGYVDSRRERIRTRFLNVPDAPVSKFVLRLHGGRNRGLVQNSADLCRHRGRAILNLAGQNGRTQRSRPKVKVKCPGPKGKRSKRHARAR